MKILVAIACYGTKNLKYLQILLSEYRRLPHEVDIVVLSNAPKDLGPNVEVLVGLPAANPWSLPFAHKPLFAQRADQYDLFIYSEDDTPITEPNLRAFLDGVRDLPASQIVGFLRYETGTDGRRHISSAHGRFHWRAETAQAIAGETFAQFTNAHSACYILTREQLRRAIASGGFLLEAYEAEYDMLCSAATDPYTRCGFTKVVNVSRLQDSLLPHLPNKYVGVMGTELSIFETQVAALKQIAAGTRPAVNAMPKWQPPISPNWLKNYYEPCSPELISMMPLVARSVLSLGIGTGATECELVRLGFDVTAVPLDPVICAPAEAKGVKMAFVELASAAERLAPQRFDCVLIRNLLYLQEHPAALLRSVSPLVADAGVLLIQEPNFGSVQNHLRRALKKPEFQNLGSFRKSRVTPVTVGRLNRWLGSAGFKTERIEHSAVSAPSAKERYLRMLPRRLSSATITIQAGRKGRPQTATS